MKSRTGKRKRWLSHKWKISAKGNPWIKADGFRVTVYRRGSGWAASVSLQDSSLAQHSSKNYKTEDQTKLAAFDHITRLLEKET